MVRTLTHFLNFLGTNKKPKLLVIGAQKAGTTTLFDLLDSLPEFCGASVKEVGFFTNDVLYRNGTDWYAKQFGNCSRLVIKFEATPGYLYCPDVPQKIFAYSKNIKFIVVFREPASRCYSAWNMFRCFNNHSAEHIYNQFVKDTNPSTRKAIKDLLFTEHFPSFKQAVLEDIERHRLQSMDVEPSFVRRGIYCEQLENYLQYFNISNFLFLEQRELSDPQKVLQKVAAFLDVEIDASLINKTPVVSNIGAYEVNDEEVSDVMFLLKDFYKPYNERLFSHIGTHYDWNEA